MERASSVKRPPPLPHHLSALAGAQVQESAWAQVQHRFRASTRGTANNDKKSERV